MRGHPGRIHDLMSRAALEASASCVVVFLADRLGDGDAELAEAQAEGLPGHAKNPRGLVLVAVGESQHGRQENAIEFDK